MVPLLLVNPLARVESESELVAGPFIETSGVALFGQYFIAEMASMILFSGLTAIVFLIRFACGLNRS